MKKENTQITNIRNRREIITTNHMDNKEVMKEYYDILYVHKFDNLGEMDQFPERQSTKIYTRKNR